MAWINEAVFIILLVFLYGFWRTRKWLFGYGRWWFIEMKNILSGKGSGLQHSEFDVFADVILEKLRLKK